ncbi:MAG: translation initiation factor [Myxococcota bacterium]
MAKKTPPPTESLRHNPFAQLAPDKPKTEPAKTADLANAPKGEAKAKALKARVVLRREKKGRGGKTVTRVQGLPPGSAVTYAKQMKKALGCGASVDGDDVLLHGTLTERGAAWLEAKGARTVIGN